MDERLKVYEEKMTKSYDSMQREFISIVRPYSGQIPMYWIRSVWTITERPPLCSRWEIFLCRNPGCCRYSRGRRVS